MLYPKNFLHKLDKELFASPTCEYRGAPFWAWNCELTAETINEQIEMLKKMGQGGYHIHVRTGMATNYLSDEYMKFVKQSVEKGKKEEMLTWLYDEDRWPSGAAGGIVTKNKAYRARYLILTPFPDFSQHEAAGAEIGSVSFASSQEGELLAVYDIQLNTDGTLKTYELTDESKTACGTKWYAYLEAASPDPWFNNQTYVNTLDPKAISEFARVTYDRYKEVVGDEFGGAIPAIFTDEPQFTQKTTLSFAHEKKQVILPWTDDLPETFKAAYGNDILQCLPELFWELPEGRVSLARYHYHDHVTELFATSFCDTLGKWCDKNGIMFTGHLMKEPTLESQTRALGEAMRCYRSFTLPGIDMLCDYHEYNTAKQAQSAAHQQGAVGILSELYGVTGWDYDFRGHKLQGDWQAALGVTVRVPHLTWMSMKGEAKRDYPASIGYQSPWYDQYALIEDNFARVNTAMTRGKPLVRVAVIHPIESYWLHWGPSEQTAAIRSQLEKNFANLTETLLFGLIDFDFISESRFPQLCDKGANPLRVGEMAYDVVIIPACHTLRKTSLKLLDEFKAAGGKLIFLGECPKYLDAVVSEEILPLYKRSTRISFESTAILEVLSDERFLDIRKENGERTDNLIYQLRRDGECMWLFIAVGKNPISPDVDYAENLQLSFKGEFAVELYDTLTGNIVPLAASYINGMTTLTRKWYMHDSLLLRLELGHGENEQEILTQTKATLTSQVFLNKVPVTLDEPNVMLLDMAEFAFDNEAFQPTEEILRADNYCRQKLNIPLREKHVVQPYLLPKEFTTHTISLRFTIPSEVVVEKPSLALEDARDAKIMFNGQNVESISTGFYVDKAIEIVALPPIQAGENILELVFPIGTRTNLEWCYLLGDFGVRVEGAVKTVTDPVHELAFGSIVHQGLPFYTGNLTYKLKVTATGTVTLRVPLYRGALLRVSVDGEDVGTIIYSPYSLELPSLSKGEYVIDIKLYNTRQNGFGQLHHMSSVFFYQSPDSWRSDGDLWCYEYQLKDVGILKSPEIQISL